MKKLSALLAAAVVVMTGTAMAATTGNLAVSANVNASCSIVGGTLSFGTLDAVNAPAVGPTPNVGVEVTCTNGTTYNVTKNDGANSSGGGVLRLKGPGATDYITYTLAMPGLGTGNGLAQPIAITGSIAAGTYVGAATGAYTDTVVLTVGP